MRRSTFSGISILSQICTTAHCSSVTSEHLLPLQHTDKHNTGQRKREGASVIVFNLGFSYHNQQYPNTSVKTLLFATMLMLRRIIDKPRPAVARTLSSIALPTLILFPLGIRQSKGCCVTSETTTRLGSNGIPAVLMMLHHCSH